MRPNPGERDRVARILARKSRIAARVGRQFADPDSRIAQEVMDILASLPERQARSLDR